MRFSANDPSNALVEAMVARRADMARAMTAAMRQVVANATAAGRASIAAGGLGPKWQNALRGNVYPRGTDALDPAGEITHKIKYAGIFEDGGTIAGRPLLWLPLEKNLPADGRKWTPKLYIQKFGRLVVVKRNGKAPLLFDPRRKAFLFVGVPSVTLHKRFDIAAATRAAVADFDAAYNANFRVAD